MKYDGYVIVRGVENNGRKWIPLPIELIGNTVQYIALLLDADGLKKYGPVHHSNVFLDDAWHDWDVRHEKEQFRYYPHSSAMGDIVDIVIFYTNGRNKKTR